MRESIWSLYSEWEKEMKETHELNFPESKLIGEGDITKIKDDEFIKYKGAVNLIGWDFLVKDFSRRQKTSR